MVPGRDGVMTNGKKGEGGYENEEIEDEDSGDDELRDF
jgi:hypothetical protein